MIKIRRIWMGLAWLTVPLAARLPSAVGAPTTASTAGAPAATHGLQDFWIVNSRSAPAERRLEQGVERLRYARRLRNGLFASRSRDEFFAEVDSSLPTLIFVHGNRLDYGQAIAAARRLALAIGPAVPAYRLVLWSWPARHVRGLDAAGNLRVKAQRSEAQGYYLAWLIDRLDPAVRLSLAGHSFGARSVAAALSALGGARVAGSTLAQCRSSVRRPVEAVLMAAAMENSALLPRGRYGRALAQVDRILITVNPRDRMLRQLQRTIRLPLLGMTGLPRQSELSDQGAKVRTLVVTPWLRGGHVWRKYTRSPAIMARLRPYLVYSVPAASDPPAGCAAGAQDHGAKVGSPARRHARR